MCKSLNLTLETKRSDGELASSIPHGLCAKHVTHVILFSVHNDLRKMGLYKRKKLQPGWQMGIIQISGLSGDPKKDISSPNSLIWK